MAVLRTITCDTCHRPKQVSCSPNDPPPTTCGECVALKEAEEKRAHLAALAALPPEERLQKIEEFIYDHRRTPHPRPLGLF